MSNKKNTEKDTAVPDVACAANSEAKHEPKNCPRCHQSFECKPGDVSNCQCNGVQLPDVARGFIAKKYNDCLCRQCLLELSVPTILFREKVGSNPH